MTLPQVALMQDPASHSIIAPPWCDYILGKILFYACNQELPCYFVFRGVALAESNGKRRMQARNRQRGGGNEDHQSLSPCPRLPASPGLALPPADPRARPAGSPVAGRGPPPCGEWGRGGGTRSGGRVARVSRRPAGWEGSRPAMEGGRTASGRLTRGKRRSSERPIQSAGRTAESVGGGGGGGAAGRLDRPTRAKRRERGKSREGERVRGREGETWGRREAGTGRERLVIFIAPPRCLFLACILRCPFDSAKATPRKIR